MTASRCSSKLFETYSSDSADPYLFFYSDTHEGRSDSSISHLCNVLYSMRDSELPRLVLGVGDLLDCYLDPPLLRSPLSLFRYVLSSETWRLFKHLTSRGVCCWWLVGNHDEPVLRIADELEAECPRLNVAGSVQLYHPWDTAAPTIYAHHGHTADPFFWLPGFGNWLPEIATRIYDGLYRRAQRLLGFRRSLSKLAAASPRAAEQYWRYCLEDAASRAPSSGIVIVGHSHRTSAYQSNSKDRILYDVGCWLADSGQSRQVWLRCSLHPPALPFIKKFCAEFVYVSPTH